MTISNNCFNCITHHSSIEQGTQLSHKESKKSESIDKAVTIIHVLIIITANCTNIIIIIIIISNINGLTSQTRSAHHTD